MEAFTTKGHWWLPGENAENALVGVLTYDPHGDTELDLFGSFSLRPRDMPIVLGKSDSDQIITLVKCVVEITEHLGGGHNWKYSKYRFEFVLMNHHFERQDTVFALVRVKYAGLENWASTKYYLSKNYVNYKEEITVDEYFQARPDAHSIVHSVDAVLDEFKVSVRCKHTRIDDELSSFPFEQNTDIQFIPSRPWGIEEILVRVFQMKLFLSLAIGTSTWPVYVEAYNSAVTTRAVTIHYNPRTRFVNRYRMKEHFMYFTLEKQRKHVEESLRNWFTIYNQLEQVIDLYNRCISNILVAEDEFLLYAKAVEVYHRQRHKGTYVDENAFAEIYETLLSHIPPRTNREIKNQIRNRLKYANNPSFGGRLRRIRRMHKNHSEKLFEDYERFIKRVADTRNYLTHYDEIQEMQACTDVQSLNKMSERLRCILELCLLSELGFDELNLHTIASNFSRSLPKPRVPETSLSTKNP